MENPLEQLLARKMFHCVRCKDLLQAPVMLVEEKGNMCHSCYEDFKGSSKIVALENVVLSAILEEMEFPCAYKTQGCNERVKYKDLKVHQEECFYQTLSCNISPECPWTGCIKKLITHCEKDHSDRVLSSLNTCYKLFEIGSIKCGFFILKSSCGTFILNAKKSEQYLKTLIYDTEKQSDYTFYIKFVAEGGDDCRKKCKPIRTVKSFIHSTEDAMISMNLESVCNYLPGERIEIHVELAENENDFIKCVPTQLECLNCKLYIKVPAYSCISGHHLCNLCAQKTKNRCSECKVGLFRNIALESLVKFVRLPCRFKDAGCMMKITNDSDHESTCDYRLWPCFVKDCPSMFPYTELILHAIDDHETANGFINLPELTMTKNVSERKVYHVLEHNLIFELIYENKVFFNPTGASKTSGEPLKMTPGISAISLSPSNTRSTGFKFDTQGTSFGDIWSSSTGATGASKLCPEPSLKVDLTGVLLPQPSTSGLFGQTSSSTGSTGGGLGQPSSSTGSTSALFGQSPYTSSARGAFGQATFSSAGDSSKPHFHFFTWSVNVIRGHNPHPYAFEVEISFGNNNTDAIKGISLKGSCGFINDTNITTNIFNNVKLTGDTLKQLNGSDIPALKYKVRVLKDM